MTTSRKAHGRCYLCEEPFPAAEYAEHYNLRHLPRLLVPAGRRGPGDASVRELLRRSADAPTLAADLIVLLHHGATAVGSAQEQLEADGGVGGLLSDIDDAVAFLVLARQTVTDAVLDAGQTLLGEASEQ